MSDREEVEVEEEGHRRSVEIARRSVDIARGGQFADARKQGEQPVISGGDEEGERKSLEEHMNPEGAGDLEDFPISTGLTTAEAEEILARVGPNKLPEKVTPKWKIFCRQLYQPMPCMIWVAGIIELAIGNYIDGGILIGIIFLNATLSFYESNKAGNAVAALKNSLKPTATVYRDGKWDHHFDATKLVPGDLVELPLGGTVPADCMINEGVVDVDESAMTGESFPVTLHEREMAKMGGNVVRGETHATVVLTGANTFFGKTASMLNTGGEGLSHMTILLLRIMVILVAASLLLSLTCFGYLLGTGVGIQDALSFTVVVIVASIPLAIEIVATTTLALGSRQMSEYGAIVSRLAAIEDMAGMNILCSDKTGTLTQNKMVIQPDAPAFQEGLNQKSLLVLAALAAKWETPPKDALDTLVLRCHLWYPEYSAKKAELSDGKMSPKDVENELSDKIGEILLNELKDYKMVEYFPFDARIKRTESVVRFPDGKIRFITKGAPHVVAALDRDDKVHHECMDTVTHYGEDGIRSIAIALSEPIESYEPSEKEAISKTLVWHLQGLLTFTDPPRDDTKATIERCQYYGVPVKMITGDNILIAKKTCKDLEMGDKSSSNWPNIQGPDHLPRLAEGGKAPRNLVSDYAKIIEPADGFAQVFPEHKFLIVETFRQLGYKCGMTGDGVNDAPALKCADVGIAVAGATDAAAAAADIVLTMEGLSTICRGVEIARIVFQRVKNFLNYRIAATLQLLVFFFIALFALKPPHYLPPPPLGYIIVPDFDDWPPYFQMPVLYLMLITLSNDGTLISVGYDYVLPSRYPEVWNLRVLFCVAIVLGIVACSSSLILLWCMLDSWNTNSIFQIWGIGGVEYGTLICGMYLKISVSDFLTLISCRTQDKPFWASMPHPILAGGACIAIFASVMISIFWPCGTLDDVPVCGMSYHKPLLLLWILIYVFVVFLIQDICKVLTYKILRVFNIFNINETNKVIKIDMEEATGKKQ